ncbi:MAG: hypothetical protein KDC66_21455, partial [Phaeodactylibacter sp.]|nr:hypothetical protein [Phaeodactylibacter sp.]
NRYFIIAQMDFYVCRFRQPAREGGRVKPVPTTTAQSAFLHTAPKKNNLRVQNGKKKKIPGLNAFMQPSAGKKCFVKGRPGPNEGGFTQCLLWSIRYFAIAEVRTHSFALFLNTTKKEI